MLRFFRGLLRQHFQLFWRFPVEQVIEVCVLFGYYWRRLDALCESFELLFDCYPLALPELAFVDILLYLFVGDLRHVFIVTWVKNRPKVINKEVFIELLIV